MHWFSFIGQFHDSEHQGVFREFLEIWLIAEQSLETLYLSVGFFEILMGLLVCHRLDKNGLSHDYFCGLSRIFSQAAPNNERNRALHFPKSIDRINTGRTILPCNFI